MSPIAARLAEPTLQGRIAIIARRFGTEAEDVRQHVTLALLERAAADPAFADQKVGYLVKYASWAARHWAEKARTYDKYVAGEPMIFDDEGGLVSALDEAWASPGLTPERAVLQRERLAALAARINGLPDKQRQVAGLTAGGYKPSEIAAALGLSRSSTSHLIRRMRLALSL